MEFDLKELLERESERVECKENVADERGVAKTICAFANDFQNLGGGYVVCGVKQTTDEHGYERFDPVGLTASRMAKLEQKILRLCEINIDPPVVPLVRALPAQDPEKRILVFIVPGSRNKAHSFWDKTEGLHYYVRISSSTKKAKNGVLRELKVKQGVMEPWDRRMNDHATLHDIDLLTLKQTLVDMKLKDLSPDPEVYLDPERSLSAMAPPLTRRRNLSDQVYPLNFALLLFSKNPTHFFPGAYVLFSIYPGRDRSTDSAERHEITGSLISQSRRLIELLNLQSYTVFDKTTPNPNQINYPTRALQEAIVNALVHRDYEDHHPVRITVFSDRIEILSPGGLNRNIDREAFQSGRASAHWRNQALAWFFSKLNLAQSEGQGIPTIFRTMKDEGCPSPSFEITPDTVTCILPAHPRHEAVKLLKEASERMTLNDHDRAQDLLESILEKDPYNYRALELYCESNNMSQTPERVFDFLTDQHISPDQFKAGTIIQVAQTLRNTRYRIEAEALASQWNAAAISKRLESSEAKKLALNFRRDGDDEGAIEVINSVLGDEGYTNTDASLLDIRAKAKMDLAKKCMDSARNRAASRETKAGSWDRCRQFLSEAEKDLETAMALTTDEKDRHFINRDLHFLYRLKEIAQKPARNQKKGNP